MPRRTIIVLFILAFILIFQGAPTPLVAQPITGPRIPLPAIDVGDGWTTWVHVQNAGDEPAVAVVELYAAPQGEEPPAAATVVGTRCSDPIPPGRNWTLELAGLSAKAQAGEMGLDDASSGFVYAVVPGTEDAGCGGDASRLPTGPLAVVVSRQQARLLPRGQADETGAPLTSAYTASPNQAEIDEMEGKRSLPDYVAYVYFTPLLTARWAGDERNSTLVLQNVGEAATTALYVQYFPQGACQWAYPAGGEVQQNLAPGQAIRLDLQEAEYPRTPFRGTAVIRSDQPLAVVVDQRDAKLRTHMSYAAPYKPPEALANYAPLAYKSFQGWETEIQVQDGSPFLNARVPVHYLDATGEPIARDFNWVCYVDAWHISPQALEEVPAGWAGALRVVSDAWWEIFDWPAPPPWLSVPTPLSVVNLVHAGGRQALSYTGFPAPQTEIDTIALPWVVKRYGSDTTPHSSRIAVQNLLAESGVTPYTLEFYGPDGLLTTLEGRLEPNQADQVDLREVAGLPDGFAGAAVVRAGESTQKGGPALGAVIAEMPDGAAGGDVSQGYAGIVVAPLPPATPAGGSVYLPLVARGGTR